MSEHDGETPKAWDRETAEPARWFARFTAFRLAGPSRSMLATYNAEREKAGKSGKAKRVPAAWANAAEKWEWRHRAEQWDAAELERIESDAQRIRDERRRALVDFEWLQARMLAEASERCIGEAGMMPALGKRRSIRDEPIERAAVAGGDAEAAVAVEKIVQEVDAGDLLRTGAKLAEIASVLARRACGLPMAHKPADGDVKVNSQPQTIIFEIETRDMSGGTPTGGT